MLLKPAFTLLRSLRLPMLFDSDYYSKKLYSTLSFIVIYTVVGCDNHKTLANVIQPIDVTLFSIFAGCILKSFQKV